MSKFADEIRKGLEDALAIERGEKKAPRRTRHEIITAHTVEVVPPPDYKAPDVRRIRDELGMSQPVFACALGKSPAAVKSWEQGRNVPDPAARRLLFFAEHYPRAFVRNVRPKPA